MGVTIIIFLKNNPANIYNKVAPIVVAVRTIKIPHHWPNTKPANISNGPAKPRDNVQTIQKIKNSNAKIMKFSLLYSKIVSLFDLINS